MSNKPTNLRGLIKDLKPESLIELHHQFTSTSATSRITCRNDAESRRELARRLVAEIHDSGAWWMLSDEALTILEALR